MQQAFAERTEARADAQKLEGTKRAIFCAETVIAYVVWLLANYDKFEKVEDNAKKTDDEEVLEEKCRNVNLLSELQECLWVVIDNLKNARVNMQKVWKVLEKLKTCGDKPFRVSHREMSTDAFREQNKKVWALSDLGIAMMLYRAKLQMEDIDTKEGAFNRQFFYICNSKDNCDPSNVFAPDVLLNDEKQRNGKCPKAGRRFHVQDLTAEFTPPPQSNETTSSVKNISRRGAANANTSKRRGGKKAAPKRRSGGNQESDDDDEEKDVVVESPKPRTKRGVYEPPESEDDEIEEVMPLPKRRGPAPPVVSTPSASNGTRNGTATRKKDPRKYNNRTILNEMDIEDDDDDREEDLSLDQIVISPILSEESRMVRGKKHVSQTYIFF